jgi:hypothetical protein
MPCNPNNPKAINIHYECNPRTNRWVKKKDRNRNKVAVKEKTVVVVKEKSTITGNCNPRNIKANNPNYRCNPLTNRWVKIATPRNKTVMKEKIGCDPRSPHANDPSYTCDPITHQWMPSDEVIKRDIIRAYPFLSAIRNIQNKTLAQVLMLIENHGGQKSKQKTVARQKTKQPKTTWQKTCKEMEEKCPMETDLSGDNWCSLDKKDVFYYVKDGKRFCYGVEEIFSIIHLGFTARDTSYQVPPLRLQLPRDSYDRTPFTEDFFKSFKAHIKKHGQTPKEPEVCYFLKYYKQFYNNPKIKPFLTQMDPNKVQLSNAIHEFLMKPRHIQINMGTSKWEWLPRKQPTSISTYLDS